MSESTTILTPIVARKLHFVSHLCINCSSTQSIKVKDNGYYRDTDLIIVTMYVLERVERAELLLEMKSLWILAQSKQCDIASFKVCEKSC